MAIGRSQVYMYITASAVNASTVASSDKITGEVKSYKQSGGEDQIDSVPVFGGFVDTVKPSSQFELEFEILPTVAGINWDQYVWAKDAAFPAYFSANAQASNYAVFIVAVNGATSNSIAFNNVNGMSIERSHNADDNRMMTVKFRFAPTTSTGISNYLSGTTGLASFPNWTALATS